MNATQIVIALSFYAGGFISGFFFSRLPFIKDGKENSTIVLIVVSAIWALSVIVDIITPEYETSPLIHGLMGAIVGFFYKHNENTN